MIREPSAVFRSASELQKAVEREFWSRFQPSCRCSSVELREERTALRCAECDAALVARKPESPKVVRARQRVERCALEFSRANDELTEAEEASRG